MFQAQQITAFANKNKSVIWGLFLATTIFRFALGNLFLVLMSVLFLAQLYHQKKLQIAFYFLPLVAYFVFGAISILWTTNYQHTIKGISIALPLLLIPFFSAQYTDFKPEEFKKTIRIFSLCLLAYLLVCFLIAGYKCIQDGQMVHFFYHDLVSIFDNNAIYVSLAVAVCILFIFSWSDKTKTDYYQLFFLILFLFLLSSKNIIITTFFLILGSLLVRAKVLKKSIVVSVFTLAVLGLIVFTNNPIKTRFLDESHFNLHKVLTSQDFYDYSFSGLEVRIFQWRLMGEMIAHGQIGFWGLGLHNVDYLTEQYFSYYNAYKGYFQINFHNQYLQTFGEIGFIGLLLLLSIFLYVIYTAKAQRTSYKICLALLFFSAFLTESFLNRQKGVFLFAMVYCLLFMSDSYISKKNIKIPL